MRRQQTYKWNLGKGCEMTKEERVLRYLDLASMPENLGVNTDDLMQELGISDDDIDEYRAERESGLSLRPVEKRDIVVKQVIKPLLKKYGFSTAGLDWHRGIDDFYIIIHMQNSQFNSIFTGVSFRFHIFARKKDEITEKLSNEWVYGSAHMLNQFDFLPYCGMLSPYYDGRGMYKIDGYKNYLPSDTPVENICRQISEDFGDYILPELDAVKAYEDFLELYIQKKKRYEEKDMRLLRYYHAAQTSALNLTGDHRSLVELGKELQLSAEDVATHLEWLDICRETIHFTKVDAKELAIKCIKG